MTGLDGSVPHVTQAGADVDRRCRPQWHRIGGAVWRGGAAGEKTEDLVRQKARARYHHMAAAMAVLVREVELPGSPVRHFPSSVAFPTGCVVNAPHVGVADRQPYPH